MPPGKTVAATLILCLGLLLPAGFASATLAGTPLDTVGNQNGTPFHGSYAPDQLLVGLGYFAAEALVNVTPVCRPVAGGVLGDLVAPGEGVGNMEGGVPTVIAAGMINLMRYDIVAPFRL